MLALVKRMLELVIRMLELVNMMLQLVNMMLKLVNMILELVSMMLELISHDVRVGDGDDAVSLSPGHRLSSVMRYCKTPLDPRKTSGCQGAS